MNPEIITARLKEFFRRRNIVATIGSIAPLAGGYQQLSWIVDVTLDDAPRRLVLRSDRPAEQILAAITDRQREWQILSALTAAAAPIPGARFVDLDGSELGSPSILSDFIEGANMLQRARAIDKAAQADLALQAADAAAAVHRLAPALLPDRAEPDWNGYLDGLLDEWRAAEANHVERMPFLRYLVAWLDRHRPAPTGLVVAHGDFSLANILIDGNGRPVVVDWEFTHLGDPRVDLGWCMYRAMLEPPSIIDDNLEAFCARYRQASGLSAEIINPRALRYFAMLYAARTWSAVLKGIDAMGRGRNSLLLSAYMISAWQQTCALWMAQIDGKLLESA